VAIRTHQSGFGLVAVLLAVVVVLALGGSGYAVYHAHHKKAPESKSTTTNQSTKSTSTTGSSTTGKSTPAVTYFTIKEWGVQAPYSGTDFTYSPVSGYSNEMWLTSQQLTNAAPQCSTGKRRPHQQILTDRYVASDSRT
jgi:Tfp pilus assembly protein PilV